MAGFFGLWDNAVIKAIPNEGYKFKSWSGDYSGNQPDLEIDIESDVRIKATFQPVFVPNSSPTETLLKIEEIVDSANNLSSGEKQSAVIELLLFGKSSKVGVDLTDGE